MVLSPMEPVAPSTVTVRTSASGALLLRNGTALIVSPNHKTAADAIGAAPQKPEKCRHDDGRDKSIQTIHQPAMAGNDVTGVLYAKTPLHGGFEQIAELRNNRENRAQHQQRPGVAQTECGKRAATARLAAKPPAAPAQVFFGLTLGQSFGPPMPRPAK